MYLVIGLGNPDKIYDNTYHNVGFLAVDSFVERMDGRYTKNECKAKTAHLNIGGKKVIVAKPQTYMNLSGQSAVMLVNKYKIKRENIIVVFDDKDIGLGALRIRENGSAGSHNGMKSIIDLFGTSEISRLRVGIGKPKGMMELRDFVLSKIDKDSMKQFEDAFEVTNKALEMFARGQDLQKVMQECNRKEGC